MNTYVFNRTSSLKRNNIIADIQKLFDLELWAKNKKITILENDNMIVDIDKRWINIIILKNDAQISEQVEDYFYN